MKRNGLVILAYASLAVAILSIFTTIVGYTNGGGEKRTFSIFDFMSADGGDFDSFVSSEYMGKVYWDVDATIIKVFAVIGIVAFVCAILGLTMISKQKENKASFLLALIGLIGSAAPSILILICLIVLGGQYQGTIEVGIYPIVSPIAMIICILATTQMHRRNLESQKKMKEVEGLMFKGGDL